MELHTLIRTNTLGEKFVGSCIRCGLEDLTFKELDDECEANLMSQEDALFKVIEG